MLIAYDDIEYSHIISDLINELSKDVGFVVDIWTDGSELPQSINTKEQDVEFLKDAIKVYDGVKIKYILYGIILVIECTQMNG